MANLASLGRDLSRRTFLQSTAAAFVAGDAAQARRTGRAPKARSTIFILMTGGPSQIETFDPKPDAPSEVRGVARPIATSVPGVAFSELLPKLARRANQFSLIRTLHHEQAPIHETGLQLVQTGRLAQGVDEFPSAGAVVSNRLPGPWPGAPAWVTLPGPLGDTGVKLAQGQSAGWLTDHVSICHRMPNDFAAMCEAAIRFVEDGARFVTINMFSGVFGQTSWDMHAASGRLPVSLETYRHDVCPSFDEGMARLLDGLVERRMLECTLVVATGEMGRSPKLNSHGGRDHWAGCWSALVAGGGVQGGRVVGESDAIAADVLDRPVSCPELVATIYHAMGVDPKSTLETPDGSVVPLVDADPIAELF